MGIFKKTKTILERSFKEYMYVHSYFRQSRSVLTYFPGGRLGNMISSFLTTYWMYLEHGLDTYLEKEAHDFLSIIFEHVDVVKVKGD